MAIIWDEDDTIEDEGLQLPDDFQLDTAKAARPGKPYRTLDEHLIMEICETLYHYAEIVPDDKGDFQAAQLLERISNYKMSDKWNQPLDLEVTMNITRGNAKDLNCWPIQGRLPKKGCDCGGEKSSTTHAHWCSKGK